MSEESLEYKKKVKASLYGGRTGLAQIEITREKQLKSLTAIGARQYDYQRKQDNARTELSTQFHLDTGSVIDLLDESGKPIRGTLGKYIPYIGQFSLIGKDKTTNRIGPFRLLNLLNRSKKTD